LKAKNYPNREKYNLLPVFGFDEIGLAELSKYNPLKVLHSLLEVENRDIGFVGISNWRLDASKMNRALYLARPDPSEEDLKFTAKCIFNQICNKMYTHHNLIENLASAYSDLKVYLKREKPEYQDFYGLRDFYHLIKLVSRSIANGVNMEREMLI
jgi:E3 ubiquitin-protein ligase RNF213